MNQGNTFIRHSVILLLLFLSHVGAGQRYARYNMVGYELERDKRIIFMSTDACEGEPWAIKDPDNTVVLSGKVGPSLTGKGKHMPYDFNYEVDFSALTSIGTYTVDLPGVEPFSLTIKPQPYDFIPGQILRYFRVQRSGTRDCLDHKSSHGGDKSCLIMRRKNGQNTEWEADPSNKKANMKGGWYDAGDYIKFTLTTAYACYLMLRSYETYPELFDQKNYSKSDVNDLLDEALHGLDYLVKTKPDEEEFIIQVGGHLDHQQGKRLPEFDELNGFRECYSAISKTQMGYTVAALALGAKTFREVPGYEDKAPLFEQKAREIFAMAEKAESPAWVESGWEKFYADETPYDNMALGAMELYLLTKEKDYLAQAKTFSTQAKAAYWVSWGSAHLQAHARVYPKNKELFEFMETDLNNFEGVADQNNNLWGVPHRYTWASLYSFLGVANGVLQFQEATKLKRRYEEIPLDVLDYTLGMNNWGMPMVASPDIPGSVENVYSQVYQLKPKLFPTGAVAEGPGDNPTHRNLEKYFQIPEDNPFDTFNTDAVVFYDLETNFQTMETTIVGLADALFFFTQISKKFAP